MKVCYLNYDGEPTLTATTSREIGGLNTIVYNLADSIAQVPDNKVMVVCRSEVSETTSINIRGSFRLLKIKDGQHTNEKPATFATLEQYASNVLEVLVSEWPDIIHTSGAEAGYVMSILRQRIAIPWVHTNYATLTVRRVMVEGCGLIESLNNTYAQRERACLTDCDVVIALSETDRKETAKVFQIPERKIIAIPPGVDTKIFKSERKRFPFPLVVSSGRMSPIKDFPFLLRAFQHTLNQLTGFHPKPQLVIIGGNLTERDNLGLGSIVREMGIESQIKFLDGMSQSKLSENFQRARVYIGCSKHETFGLLPVEARACGAPFVVRANSAYLDTAVDGFGGYFVDNSDETHMGEKIAEILRLSEAEWLTLSQQAVASTERFRWSETATKNLLVYQQVVANKFFKFFDQS